MADNPASNVPAPAQTAHDPTDWGNISKHFKARISLCDDLGNILPGSPQIVAIVIDGDMATESDYSSPFDNSSPDNKLPTMMAMLQSGVGVETSSTLLKAVMGIQLSGDQKGVMNAMKGRSSLTKVNSRQIFNSTQPIMLNLVLYFEAWANAKAEVEDQLNLLQQWSLPASLAEDSLIAGIAENPSLESLMPSEIPPFVSIIHGGKRYAPMLIRPLSVPVAVPMDKDGNRMFAQVPVTFSSLTAWDKNNVANLYYQG